MGPVLDVKETADCVSRAVHMEVVSATLQAFLIQRRRSRFGGGSSSSSSSSSDGGAAAVVAAADDDAADYAVAPSPPPSTPPSTPIRSAPRPVDVEVMHRVGRLLGSTMGSELVCNAGHSTILPGLGGGRADGGDEEEEKKQEEEEDKTAADRRLNGLLPLEAAVSRTVAVEAKAAAAAAAPCVSLLDLEALLVLHSDDEFVRNGVAVASPAQAMVAFEVRCGRRRLAGRQAGGREGNLEAEEGCVCVCGPRVSLRRLRRRMLVNGRRAKSGLRPDAGSRASSSMRVRA